MHTAINLDTLERNLAEVLRDHIEALRANADSPAALQFLVSKLLAAYDRVTAIGGPELTPPGKTEVEPWPAPGTLLWREGENRSLLDIGKNRRPCVVQATFVGRDGHHLCVLESIADGKSSYVTVPVYALAPEREGKNFFERACDHNPTLRRAWATDMLRRAGIVDSKGMLRAGYDGEGEGEDGRDSFDNKSIGGKGAAEGVR